MQSSEAPPEIFDRKRRYTMRQRAHRYAARAFLWQYIAQELKERLALVTRELQDVLLIGPIAAFAGEILGDRNCTVHIADIVDPTLPSMVRAEEDRLSYKQHSFDLVVSAGVLDSVNDLPGALIQIRHILKPDGLFLGHMFGAGSLATLKSRMVAAEAPVATPHIHPQIDLRSAADLLSRAGFTLPVADGDMLPVRYGDWRTLVRDLRDAGIGNALTGPRRYLGRDYLARLDRAWQAGADPSGRGEEQFMHLFLSGWSPSANQPKPARRGSGEVSLASILRPADKG